MGHTRVIAIAKLSPGRLSSFFSLYAKMRMSQTSEDNCRLGWPNIHKTADPANNLPPVLEDNRKQLAATNKEIIQRISFFQAVLVTSWSVAYYNCPSITRTQFQIFRKMAEEKDVDYVADSTTYLDTYDYYRRGLLEQQSVWVRQHVIPVLMQNFQNQSNVRILSVGSGEGDIDILILDALLQQMNDNSIKNTNIEYVVVERNPEFVDRFKQRIQRQGPDYSKVNFKFCLDTLENLESELSGSMFNVIFLIHVLYYMDAGKMLQKCMEKYLKSEGAIVAVVQQEANLYSKNWKHFSIKFRDHVGHFNLLCETDLAAIAKENNWKHRIEAGKRIIDVSDVIGTGSPNAAGWKLLEFFLHSNNLEASLNKEELKEVIDFFKANAVFKDGKHIATGDETIAFIFN